MSFADQVAEGRKRLLDWGAGINVVGLVKIDIVNLQAPETIFARSQNPSSGQSLTLQRMIVALRKILTHRGTHFRRDQNPVAVSGRLQPSPNNLFGDTSWIVWSPDRV